MAHPVSRRQLRNFMETYYLISILPGLLTGIVLALTGAGGTIIAVPLLMFSLHLTVAEAAPVGLLAVSLSAGIGAVIAFRQKKVRYRAASLIALTGALAAPAGLWAAQHVPNTPLTLLFAGVLIYVAIHMFRHNRLDDDGDVKTSAGPPCRINDIDGRLAWNFRCFRALAMSGTMAGFLSGLLGVGGGFVVVPALRKATNLDMPSIMATSLAIIALISSVGVISSILIHTLQWPVAIPFCIGTVAGMLLGRMFAARFAGQRLQQGFAILAIVVAIAMIIKAAWNVFSI